ncbi:MAG: serine protease, partial [Acidobacteria bacterium]|nr:serine protease [Acidobacteriota bacterium]
MRRVFFQSLLLVLVLPLAAAAQDFLPELVKRIKPSAVAIEAFDSRGQTIARGSGFFVGADRIITNRHVIEGSYRAEAHLLNDKRVPVKGVIAVDGEGDLALLQVDLPANVFVNPLPLVR